MFVRILTNAVFIILFALVTFFGLGPVLLADGSAKERMTVLTVVLIIYIILGISFIYINKYLKKKYRR